MSGISLKPKDAVETTGLLDDVDVEIIEAAFEMWDYAGKMPQASPALKLKLAVADATGGQELHDQYFSAGKASDWAPTPDGKQLQAIGTATALNTSCNTAIVLKSLVDAGFPEDKIGDDISVFVGLKGHVNRLPAPKRPGLKRAEGDREQMVLCVTKIISLPGEGATTPAAGAASAPANPVADATTAVIMELIMEAGGKLPKAAIPSKVFAKVKDRADKNAIVQLAFKDEFLSAGPWTYKDGVLTV